MKHANDLSVAVIQSPEKGFDEIAVVDASLLARYGDLRVTQPLLAAATGDLADGDPPGDDGEIGRKRRPLLESTKHREVVLEDRLEDLGDDIVSVGSLKRDTATVRRELHDVNERADEAIDEVVPRSDIAAEAPCDQRAIEIGESDERDVLLTGV